MAKKKKQKNKKHHKDQRSITAVAASFSGPLPPPSILHGYENIQPGFAERIIKMAESQAEHRQGLEKSVVNSNIENERKGMWFAFILTIVLMGLGFYLIIDDKSTAGYFAVFGPVVFHTSNFIYNKRREERSLDKNGE
ncbi:DUF2335 domain-containing protein [Candidatus Peregrinibacteria bacterium]|nr:DUF2335 domain-containing protein [Candidatus Peregrinibacteria bacterium]